jgi:hypothetical protein
VYKTLTLTSTTLAVKKLLLFPVFTLIALLSFSACKDSDTDDEIQPLVPIAGTFTNTPDPAAGFWEVPLPDGSVFYGAKKYIVNGTCDYLGDIDETQSFITTTNVVFNGIFSLNADITLANAQGDKLFLSGTVYSYADFSNNGYFHITGGAGRFADADGWMNSTGQFDMNGVNNLTSSGEVSEPR